MCCVVRCGFFVAVVFGCTVVRYAMLCYVMLCTWLRSVVLRLFCVWLCACCCRFTALGCEFLLFELCTAE